MAEGQVVDPIVEVTVLNEKKYTTAKDDIGAAATVAWQEHLFYEPKNLVRFIYLNIFPHRQLIKLKAQKSASES